MHSINKYADTIKKEFYLDDQGQLRRAKNGYFGRFKKGDLANSFITPSGYLRIQVPKKRTTVNVSHVVVLLDKGSVPDDFEIDHIDGNKRNNHPANLRVVDRQLNCCNRKKRSDNTSGITGIRWSEHHGHYVIRRTIHGKRLSRSRKTLEEAKMVLDEFHQMDTAYTDRHGK